MSTRSVSAVVFSIILLAVFGIAQGVADMAESLGFHIWSADPLVKVLPNSPVPAGASAQVDVDAVRNEYESAQLVVTAESDIEELRVEVSELAGPSKLAPRVEAHFLGFVPVKHGTTDTPPEHLLVKAPADLPDPLLDVRSISVEAGKNQPIWLTVFVPKKTSPGVYVGTISVDSDECSIEVPLSVRVHPAVVPDERTLYLTNWFSVGNIASARGLKAWSEAYWKMLRAYAWCMADHRQSVVLTPILSLVRVHDDGNGKLTFDFSRFDRWVDLFTKAGVVGIVEGGHLAGRTDWEAKEFVGHWPTITMPDGSARPRARVTVGSDEYREFCSQFLPALQSHLEDKGWLDIYLQHLADEPIPQNAESYNKLSSYVRQYAPGMRIIDASMCTEIAGSIDVWVPQPQELEKKADFFEARRKAGDEIWFYTCLAPKGKYMNRFVDYPLIKTRLLHWMNFKYDLPGYLHWGFNHWHGDPFADLEPDWGGGSHLPPGDSHIVYPGKRGPLSSVRLEALRDGVEDYELLRLLEKKDSKKARRICDSVVRSMTDYTLNPADFRAARAKLIRALE